MLSTSASLLERLRRPGEQGAWERFVDLYMPLLLHWARRQGLQDADAADLVQDVFAVLVRKLPEFSYDPGRSFRAWLHTVLLSRWRDRQRRQAAREQAEGEAAREDVAAPDPAGVLEESEYRRHVVGRALDLVRPEFQAGTWQAFCEHGLRGRPAAEVAAELGLSTGAVYAARFRVLSRVRELLAGLLD
jgi:RNA polymerase sigma-70 factor (ECF subfamily)